MNMNVKQMISNVLPQPVKNGAKTAAKVGSAVGATLALNAGAVNIEAMAAQSRDTGVNLSGAPTNTLVMPDGKKEGVAEDMKLGLDKLEGTLLAQAGTCKDDIEIMKGVSQAHSNILGELKTSTLPFASVVSPSNIQSNPNAEFRAEVCGRSGTLKRVKTTGFKDSGSDQLSFVSDDKQLSVSINNNWGITASPRYQGAPAVVVINDRTYKLNQRFKF
jgi:hypothetical protein